MKSFDCACDLYNVSIRKTTKYFYPFELWRICNFLEKYPFVLKKVFKQQRLQGPEHSNFMVDKHMSRMTVFVCSINISQIRSLYFRFVRFVQQNF